MEREGMQPDASYRNKISIAVNPFSWEGKLTQYMYVFEYIIGWIDRALMNTQRSIEMLQLINNSRISLSVKLYKTSSQSSLCFFGTRKFTPGRFPRRNRPLGLEERCCRFGPLQGT